VGVFPQEIPKSMPLPHRSRHRHDPIVDYRLALLTGPELASTLVKDEKMGAVAAISQATAEQAARP